MRDSRRRCEAPEGCEERGGIALPGLPSRPLRETRRKLELRAFWARAREPSGRSFAFSWPVADGCSCNIFVEVSKLQL